jgi:cell division protein FtsI (penicillin-binding protein 3)
VPVGLARKTLHAVQRFRVQFVFGAVLVLFAALLAKVGHMQLVKGPEYRAMAAKQDVAWKVRAVRGAVLDRQSRGLAVSRPVRSVRVNAGRKANGEWAIADVPLFAASLSDLLDGSVTAMDLRERVFRRRGTATGAAWLPLRRNVEDPVLVSRLDEADLDGLEVGHAESREYPNGSWAGHVLGRASRPSPDSALRGGENGVEAALDAYLSGSQAVRRVRIHPGNRLFVASAPDVPVDTAGRTAVLTIDLVIQGYCEQALDRMTEEWKPKAAVAIVVDPANGDVLALAVRPDADPSDPEAGPAFNYATSGRLEVGSTFKPFMLARALDAGVVRADESVPMGAQRTFRVGKATRTVRDAHDGGGEVPESGSLIEATAESSNPAFAELAHRLGPDAMRRLLDDLDVSGRYGLLGVPEKKEVEGTVGEGGNWSALHHVGVGFGHGFAMTPLRLACAFAAFARDDFAPVRPRLVLSIGGEPVPESPPFAPLSTNPATRDLVRRALRATVVNGTATRTVSSESYAIAGKTGTAKRPSGNGYYSASFVGYAPAEAPRLVVLVTAVEPVLRSDGARPYGGAIAGPAAKSILERSLGEYLGVPARGAARSATGSTGARLAGEEVAAGRVAGEEPR